MKRITNYLTFFCLITFFSQVHAFDGYIEITPPQPTQAENQIEVLEIFWYGCPHCYDFEPFINDWLKTKPDNVMFRRMPGIFQKSWIPHAKAYYTAEKLGVLNSIHNAMFKAIHQKKKKLSNDSSIKKFFINNNVSKSDFKKTYESDVINTKIKQAYIMGQRYKITGVPAVIVNGKYMVSGTTAGGFENMIKVINLLIEQESSVTE